MKYFYEYLGSTEMDQMIEIYTSFFILVMVGVSVTIIALSGCFAAVFENKYILWTFGTLMILMIIIEIDIYVTILIFKAARLDLTKDAMTRSMTQYNNPAKEDVKRIWDEIQLTFTCCGVEKTFGEDWKNKFDIQANTAPDSCCKTRNSKGCGTEAIGTTKLFKNGCIREFDEFFDHTFFFVGRVGIALIVMQVIAIITGCCMATKYG